MKTNRVARVILGLIVLILFGVYSYVKASNSPFSQDVDDGTVLLEDEELPAAPEGQPVPEGEAPVGEPAQEAETEATPEPTVDPESPAGRAQALGLPAPPDIDINSWEYILVNKTHEVGSDYAPPEIVNVSSSQCPQDSRIADALQSFADGCAAEGLPVYLSSGYRSYYEQSQTFNAKVASVGYDAAAKIVNPPGTSEHQTGLCCDITDVYRNPKDPDVLSQTETFKWLEAHCTEYGFILRYPNGEVAITDVIYEPWHFRYVGTEAASYIMDNALTLEEFVALYTGEEVPGAEAPAA